MALTDRQVRLAKAGEKLQTLRDGQGLYLVVKPSGTKVWRYDYAFANRRKTLTVGRYPQVGLQDAREARIAAQRQIAGGGDPSWVKQEKRRQLAVVVDTIGDAVDEHNKMVGKQRRSQATVNRVEWLGSKLKKEFGNKSLIDVRPHEILAFLQRIESNGNFVTARQMRAYISAIYRRAIVRGDVEVDPSYALPSLERADPAHHPAIIVERDFGRLLNVIAGYDACPVSRAALHWLSLTFVRPGEMRGAVWDEIDLEDSVWRIPAERTKKRRVHDVPLVPATRKILSDMGKRTGMEGYIFQSRVKRGCPISLNTIHNTLERLGYSGIHTAHGFRASASSILNERSFRSEVVEMQLAHLDKSTVRRAYNRALYWNERVDMMHQWSELLKEFRSMTL